MGSIIDPTSEVVQVNAYYPFGLNHGANINGAGGAYKYQYNGKELDDDLSLNWNDYGARFYDAAIGRFWTVDRISEHEDQIAYTDYHFGFDDPIKSSDPTGECPSIVGAIIGAAVEYGGQVIVNKLDGKTWKESLIQIDVSDLLIAGAEGTLTS